MISDPERNALSPRVMHTDWTAIAYVDELGRRLELLDNASGTRHRLLESADPELDILIRPVGDFLHYGAAGEPSHLVTLDATGSVVDTELNVTLDRSALRALRPQPDDKVALYSPDTFSLTLVALSAPDVKVEATIHPSAGERLGCPLWAADGSAFVYVEPVAETRKLFVVRWGKDGPLAPELVYTGPSPAAPIVLWP